MTRSILCGTIALAVISATALAADTSEDARLKKLEAAVSQLQQENASLKNELHAQESTDFASSAAAKIKMSDSISEVRLFGEGRLRYFMNEGVAAGADAGDTGQRERLRYRLRLGADIKLQENWMLGFVLETNNSARSANVTLGEQLPIFNKATVSTTSVLTGVTTSNASFLNGATLKGGKVTTTSGKTLTAVSASKGTVVSNVNFGDDLFVGRIFLRNQPTDWLTITGGKIPNPFVSTRMTWDPDISPEGFSEQIKVTLGGGSHGPNGKDVKEVQTVQQGMTVDLFANFGQFIYNDVGFENSFNTGTGPFTEVPNLHDRWMFEYQIGTKVNFNKDTYFKIAPAFYHYTGGGSSTAGPFNGDNAIVLLDNKANPELVTFNQVGVNDLAVIDIPVEFAWKMWNTRFSIFGDYAQNLDAASRAANAGHENTRQGQAWQLGAGIGQTKKKGDWELRGWYQHSEQFALDPNIVDDDIFDGRLNMQGWYIQGTYMLTDAASIILQYSHGSRIDTNLGTAGSGALGTPSGFPLQSTNLVYIDLNLKF